MNEGPEGRQCEINEMPADENEQHEDPGKETRIITPDHQGDKINGSTEKSPGKGEGKEPDIGKNVAGNA